MQITKPKTSNVLSEQPKLAAASPSRPLLSVSEAAAWLGMSRSWLQKSRVYGNGPVATVLGRRVLYDMADLEAYLATRKQVSTSAELGTQNPT
jgi:predicted DNA-binding transcriptional regulator AlpA